MSVEVETDAEASERDAPPFPEDHRREFVVWADIDRFGMPRDAFAHEQRYLKTKSTGTLHAIGRFGSCINPGRMVEVTVPLVSDRPDTAKRCNRCIGYRTGEDAPPRAVANAVALVKRLKWLADFVTALEARVPTLDRASTLALRRRGPLSAHFDDDTELDPRVRRAGRDVLAALERRRRNAFEHMERRLRDDRSDIDQHLDRLVVRIAVRDEWAELGDESKVRLWQLVRSVDSRSSAEHVWQAASGAWVEAVPADHAARLARVDEAMTPYLDAPVTNVAPIREETWLASDGASYGTPVDWLDAEFRAMRTRLAERWVRALDARLAAARRLRSEVPDHWLVVTDWDADGPTRLDDDHAVLTAFPHTTAEVERTSTWATRSGTVALVRAPAVLACWLAGNDWGTFDMGVADGPLDVSTLHRLHDLALGRLDG